MAVYRNSRPSFVIELVGGAQLGNCYSACYHRITATGRVSKEALKHLWDAGLIGFGQEWTVKSQHDGKEEPAGQDDVMCVDEVTGEPAVNPYTGKLYGSAKLPYYVYEIESRCDSGD